MQLITLSTFTFRVAIMTCRTRSSVQRLGMAVATGGATVVDASPTFIRNPGMGTVVRRIPVICCMAACTIQAEHAYMESWIRVTARTVRR